MTAYVVGVDVGTTFTAAGIGTRLGGSYEATPLPLGTRTGSMPSVAFLPATGDALFGDDAEAHAYTEPDRVVREYIARVGDYVPIVVGERTVSAEEITAATVRHAVQVAAHQEGAPAEMVVVTHPASWGTYKRHALSKALTDGGVEDVTLLSEPVAAAMRIAAHEDIEPGQVVAVYDLGGRSFDAAVLRRTADGFDVLGPPTGIAELGGVDFDQAVFDHLRVGVRLPAPDPSDPELLAAMGRIRLACVEAKETLSGDTAATIPVVLPAGRTRVRLTRGEFEGMIWDALASTVTCLAEAIESAGVAESDVAAILLVGGSSRIPLAAQLISERFASPLLIDRDPKATVALGAARHGAGLLAASAVGEELAADEPAEPMASPTAPPELMTATPALSPSGRHSRADDEADDAVLVLASVETDEANAGRHHFVADQQRGRHRRFRAALLAAGTAVVVAGASVAITLITEPSVPVPSAVADEVPTTKAKPPAESSESGPAGAPESAQGDAAGELGASMPEGVDDATDAGGAEVQSGTGSGGGARTPGSRSAAGTATSASSTASTTASTPGSSTAASSAAAAAAGPTAAAANPAPPPAAPAPGVSQGGSSASPGTPSGGSQPGSSDPPSPVNPGPSDPGPADPPPVIESTPNPPPDPDPVPDPPTGSTDAPTSDPSPAVVNPPPAAEATATSTSDTTDTTTSAAP